MASCDGDITLNETVDDGYDDGIVAWDTIPLSPIPEYGGTEGGDLEASGRILAAMSIFDPIEENQNQLLSTHREPTSTENISANSAEGFGETSGVVTRSKSARAPAKSPKPPEIPVKKASKHKKPKQVEERSKGCQVLPKMLPRARRAKTTPKNEEESKENVPPHAPKKVDKTRSVRSKNEGQKPQAESATSSPLCSTREESALHSDSSHHELSEYSAATGVHPDNSMYDIDSISEDHVALPRNEVREPIQAEDDDGIDCVNRRTRRRKSRRDLSDDLSSTTESHDGTSVEHDLPSNPEVGSSTDGGMVIQLPPRGSNEKRVSIVLRPELFNEGSSVGITLTGGEIQVSSKHAQLAKTNKDAKDPKNKRREDIKKKKPKGRRRAYWTSSSSSSSSTSSSSTSCSDSCSCCSSSDSDTSTDSSECRHHYRHHRKNRRDRQHCHR